MNHYLITIVLLTSCIQRKVAADKPHLAICNLIQQIGKPKEIVSSLTCRVLA
jgi:hypothetical protein